MCGMIIIMGLVLENLFKYSSVLKETHQIWSSYNIYQNKLLAFVKFWLIVIIKS